MPRHGRQRALLPADCLKFLAVVLRAGPLAFVVGVGTTLYPALAFASLSPKRMVSMMSSRGFWVALTVTFGGLYSVWYSRRRRHAIDNLMQRRALSKIQPTSADQQDSWSVLRHAIEKELGCELPHLREQDALRSLMKWGEIRSVISTLEDDLDIELPDTRRVLKLTVGEFAKLLSRCIRRRAGSAPANNSTGAAGTAPP